MSRKKEKYIPYDYEAAYKYDLEKLHQLFVDEMLRNGRKYIYALKEITAGEQFEVEIYPQFTKISDVPEEGRIKKDNSKAQKNLNDVNAKKYVIRLLNHNFTDKDIWITLTYDAEHEPETMEEAVRNVQNYIKTINRYRKKNGLPNAKYIYITEHSPEDEIRWHHHMVMDGAVAMDVLEEKWRKGTRNRTRRIYKNEDGLEGMGVYITKKDINFRKKHERRWNSSKNLESFRTRKVYSKPSTAAGGTYRKIERYVKGFIENHNSIEVQMKKWYPDMEFTDYEIRYNGFNNQYYVRAKMRRRLRN